MARKSMSWQEKLNNDKGYPKVVEISGTMSRRWGTGTVVIPAPKEVDAYMRSVPSGKVVTINDIRQALARKHGATIGCPMTTGIFAWVAAHAADEQAFAGEKNVTPYWRTLKTCGELNPKYPGGIEAQAALLEKEGHNIVYSRGKARVRDYEKNLAEL